MALTHNVCGSNVKAFCLKLADGTDDNWVALSCPVCYTTVTMGECAGVLDATPEIYGQTFVPYGDANKFLRSNGAGAAPTWETGPVGPQGNQGIQGIQGIQGVPGADGSAGAGILALQGINAAGTAGPFTDNIRLQVVNPFANFPAGVLNLANRRMVTKFHGHFVTAGGETPTVDFILEMSTVDIATITTGALTAGVASGKFILSFETIALSAGATAILQSTGVLDIQLDGTVYTTYRLAPVQTGAAINLTGTGKPKLNAKCHGTTLNAIEIEDAFAQFLPAVIP